MKTTTTTTTAAAATTTTITTTTTNPLLWQRLRSVLWHADVEVLPVGEVGDDPVGGDQREVVDVEGAALGHRAEELKHGRRFHVGPARKGFNIKKDLHQNIRGYKMEEKLLLLLIHI